MDFSKDERVVRHVNQLFVELFELPEQDLVPGKLLFDDLGLDSLDAIDMAIRFQKEFRMKPTNQEVQGLRTLGDIYNLVGRYSKMTESTPSL